MAIINHTTPPCRTKELYRSGHSVTDRVRWEITATEPISDQDVTLIISARYPPEGYGSSKVSRLDACSVVVESWASCD